ncbi:hypothetical protein PUN28_002807 [Cardiocondyla obscurior]|uniref:Ribosomal protein L34 n=1 Tax=Cardiocondyla obscurior TaxID=286306 RepID=A0AAW2GWE3_9HYME
MIIACSGRVALRVFIVAVSEIDNTRKCSMINSSAGPIAAKETKSRKGEASETALLISNGCFVCSSREEDTSFVGNVKSAGHRLKNEKRRGYVIRRRRRLYARKT